jgi:hypothetical protein
MNVTETLEHGNGDRVTDELRAIIWRLIKQQGGRLSLDMTPPPAGFQIRTADAPTSARYVILIAE